jgi:hypothetical protein
MEFGLTGTILPFIFPETVGNLTENHPNCSEVHHFSEGLAATTNQILLGQHSSDFHVANVGSRHPGSAPRRRCVTTTGESDGLGFL